MARPAHASPAPDDRSVHLGQPAIDTLTATRAEAYRAAVTALHGDHWVIAEGRVDSTRIVTDWKALQHPIVQLFGGNVQARCVVRLAAIGADRIEVSLQGGLVMSRGMSESPLMALADRTYSNEARVYLTKVRKALTRDRLTSARTGL